MKYEYVGNIFVKVLSSIFLSTDKKWQAISKMPTVRNVNWHLRRGDKITASDPFSGDACQQLRQALKKVLELWNF